jgi:hypothetical protein
VAQPTLVANEASLPSKSLRASIRRQFRRGGAAVGPGHRQLPAHPHRPHQHGPHCGIQPGRPTACHRRRRRRGGAAVGPGHPKLPTHPHRPHQPGPASLRGGVQPGRPAARHRRRRPHGAPMGPTNLSPPGIRPCRESNDSRHDHLRALGPAGRRPAIVVKRGAKAAVFINRVGTVSSTTPRGRLGGATVCRPARDDFTDLRVQVPPRTHFSKTARGSSGCGHPEHLQNSSTVPD